MSNDQDVILLHQIIRNRKSQKAYDAFVHYDYLKELQNEANLSGVDLSGSNLTGLRLDRMNLSGANLSEANLSSSDLSCTNLNNAILRGATLNGTNLIGATLNGASLVGADLTNAKVCLDLEMIQNMQPYTAKIIGDKIYSFIPSCQFIGANLNKANLSGLNLQNILMNKANLSEANLCNTNLSKAHLSNADLFAANLTNSKLYKARLNNAILRGAILCNADLSGANLSDSNLSRANLAKANLSAANLNAANLDGADLSEATLVDANLEYARLVETNLMGAVLTDCRVYGVSAWGVKLEDIKEQTNLRVTPKNEPEITVDNLEVAQFVYLLLHNEKIRSVIDTIGKKGVLILGRFTKDRKVVLDAIRTKLRILGFVPMMFDFERPTQRDFTETIKTLAGMSRFIIADITNPKSSPLELQATMPDYMIPFAPILHEDEEAFSMFRDLKNKYEWVLDILKYDSVDGLITVLDQAIVKPALLKAEQLQIKKATEMRERHVRDYT